MTRPQRRRKTGLEGMVDEQLELRRELRQVNKQLRLELREERRRCDEREKWYRKVVWALLVLVTALAAAAGGLRL